jgi:two-component system response regulator VicR
MKLDPEPPVERAMSDVASVLVADDEPQVVQVLKFSLEAEGYVTYVARDGFEALQLIRELQPKLVVLDVMMPKLDGWSVLAQLSKLPREERPRVIMVTALATVADRARAATLGAAAYVPKPFDMEELLAVLHDLDVAS